MKEIDADIFNLQDEQPEPLKGSLLVARPTVEDMFFGRTVVAMMHHDSEGSMGLVLNKLTNFTLDEIVDDLTIAEKVPVYFGGPVNMDLVFYVHNLSPDVIPDGEHITGDLYLGGDFDAVKNYLESGNSINDHMRFYMGYSGWDAGQLAGEIKRHDWVVLDDVMAEWMMSHRCDDMWEDAVSRFGDRYRLWKNWPEYPGEN
ncbi:MAG: YqgE/AlgH family protein [Muribaculaceae bacterium]|nr:YqgE/AlgH family protein [Muribaculaceae bacterium]